jgi:hypothetical protein
MTKAAKRPLSSNPKDPTEIFQQFVKNLDHMQTLARSAASRAITGDRAKAQ